MDDQRRLPQGVNAESVNDKYVDVPFDLLTLLIVQADHSQNATNLDAAAITREWRDLLETKEITINNERLRFRLRPQAGWATIREDHILIDNEAFQASMVDGRIVFGIYTRFIYMLVDGPDVPLCMQFYVEFELSLPMSITGAQEPRGFADQVMHSDFLRDICCKAIVGARWEMNKIGKYLTTLRIKSDGSQDRKDVHPSQSNTWTAAVEGMSDNSNSQTSGEATVEETTNSYGIGSNVESKPTEQESSGTLFAGWPRNEAYWSSLRAKGLLEIHDEIEELSQPWNTPFDFAPDFVVVLADSDTAQATLFGDSILIEYKQPFEQVGIFTGAASNRSTELARPHSKEFTMYGSYLVWLPVTLDRLPALLRYAKYLVNDKARRETLFQKGTASRMALVPNSALDQPMGNATCSIKNDILYFMVEEVQPTENSKSSEEAKMSTVISENSKQAVSNRGEIYNPISAASSLDQLKDSLNNRPLARVMLSNSIGTSGGEASAETDEAIATLIEDKILLQYKQELNLRPILPDTDYLPTYHVSMLVPLPTELTDIKEIARYGKTLVKHQVTRDAAFERTLTTIKEALDRAYPEGYQRGCEIDYDKLMVIVEAGNNADTNASYATSDTDHITTSQHLKCQDEDCIQQSQEGGLQQGPNYLKNKKKRDRQKLRTQKSTQLGSNVQEGEDSAGHSQEGLPLLADEEDDQQTNVALDPPASSAGAPVPEHGGQQSHKPIGTTPADLESLSSLIFPLLKSPHLEGPSHRLRKQIGSPGNIQDTKSLPQGCETATMKQSNEGKQTDGKDHSGNQPTKNITPRMGKPLPYLSHENSNDSRQEEEEHMTPERGKNYARNKKNRERQAVKQKESAKATTAVLQRDKRSSAFNIFLELGTIVITRNTREVRALVQSETNRLTIPQIIDMDIKNCERDLSNHSGPTAYELWAQTFVDMHPDVKLGVQLKDGDDRYEGFVPDLSALLQQMIEDELGPTKHPGTENDPLEKMKRHIFLRAHRDMRTLLKVSFANLKAKKDGNKTGLPKSEFEKLQAEAEASSRRLASEKYIDLVTRLIYVYDYPEVNLLRPYTKRLREIADAFASKYYPGILQLKVARHHRLGGKPKDSKNAIVPGLTVQSVRKNIEELVRVENVFVPKENGDLPLELKAVIQQAAKAYAVSCTTNDFEGAARDILRSHGDRVIGEEELIDRLISQVMVWLRKHYADYENESMNLMPTWEQDAIGALGTNPFQMQEQWVSEAIYGTVTRKITPMLLELVERKNMTKPEFCKDSDGNALADYMTKKLFEKAITPHQLGADVAVKFFGASLFDAEVQKVASLAYFDTRALTKRIIAVMGQKSTEEIIFQQGPDEAFARSKEEANPREDDQADEAHSSIIHGFLHEIQSKLDAFVLAGGDIEDARRPQQGEKYKVTVDKNVLIKHVEETAAGAATEDSDKKQDDISSQDFSDPAQYHVKGSIDGDG